MQWKDRWYELVRCAINRLVAVDPLMHLTFATADAIIATSNSTRDLVPARYRHKTAVQLAIGVDAVAASQPPESMAGFKVLFVGRLLAWKGVTLAVRAFAKLKAERPDCRLTVIGKGPMLTDMIQLEGELGIAGSVEHIDEVDHEQLRATYGDYDLMLFPSMRDSGGLVVLESLRSGTPVICLDQGGPGTIVNDGCGRAIHSRQAEENVVSDLASALIELANDPGKRHELRRGAVLRASEFTWAHLVERLYVGLPLRQRAENTFHSENETAHIR
jgi:glycosyltransferase involved in cell wall biosynthesis